jgi:hypothetical protein
MSKTGTKERSSIEKGKRATGKKAAWSPGTDALNKKDMCGILRHGYRG